MISISKNKNKNVFFASLLVAFLIGFLFLLVDIVKAADPTVQTISVTPTLFNIKAVPGQVWKSDLRVINVNDYDITVYPQVVNFTAQGESGRVNLLPVLEPERNGHSLAEWIDLSSAGILVPSQKTVSLPFSVSLPTDASPGSHHAAILVGTRPPASTDSSSKVQTAQFVTALVFLRVEGDVSESGSVRSFRSLNSIIQTAEASFELRFENTGNVDLQPQGDITIYNMWGEVRGSIPINQQTNYGNVVANSIRQFLFSWKGENSFFDIGRYKAVVTLGFGEETKSFVNSSTYFWIVPYQQILILAVILLILYLFFSWITRRYIRHMLIIAGINPDHVATGKTAYISRFNDQTLVSVKKSNHDFKKYQKLLAPISFGIADLHRRLRGVHTISARIITFIQFLFSYRLLLATLVVMIAISLGLIWYFNSVHVVNRQYEVVISDADNKITISSEEIFYNNLVGAEQTGIVNSTKQNFSINITNTSGKLGVAALTKLKLETSGYFVNKLSSDLERRVERTIIIYDPKLSASALALSQLLGGALLSAGDESTLNTISIMVGSDLIKE